MSAAYDSHRSQRRVTPSLRGQPPSGPERGIESALGDLVRAAFAWADRDYGDVGELEADAALNDAVSEFRRVAGADSSALLRRMLERGQV